MLTGEDVFRARPAANPAGPRARREAAAGADGDLGLVEQLHGEVDRAQALAPLARVAGPDEHARLRGRHLPADAPEALDQHVAPPLVDLRLPLDGLVAVAQGDDAGDL